MNTQKISPQAAAKATAKKPVAKVTSKDIPKDLVRVIKKYPNRRLYDTDTSTYITLVEVKKMVMQNTPFVVRDAKTNEDITRSMLLQIILEEEAGGAPMFTEAVLANIIRFYGHSMQGFVGSYLEKNVQTFTDVQASMGKQATDLAPDAWAQFMNQGVMGTYMQQMQKQTDTMLSVFGLKPKG